VSLVHFVRTRDGIRNYHAFYMELLGYYALALREREDVNVENLMLYVLDEGKLYENEFKENEFVSEYIASAVKSISENEYPKFRVNCDSCEFSGLICQFEK
jgi:CRISPR/Cas system-associated exonuclease Cas4 (RecB family)